MTSSAPAERLAVVLVTKYATGGGAERIAAQLHRGLLERGHRSWLATAAGGQDDPTIVAIPRPPVRRNVGSRMLLRAARALDPYASDGGTVRAVREALRTAAAPRRPLAFARGREWFEYPGTAAIPDLPPTPPDLVHGHNLHGAYFDLRQLAPMSARLPVALTLHDEWTFTGHCAYTLGCERWQTGCGSCPHLDVYPAIRRDGSRANRRTKADIYARSRLYVTTPSQWLMDRARRSILAPGVGGWRTIPNGVDRSVFRPADQAEARRRLGLPPDPFILLFTANQARRSPFKDWETVSQAVARAATSVSGRPVLGIALGDDGPTERFENGELRFEPYRSSMGEVAAFYQAADLYLHAARAENLPTTILEALASGLPVIATAVGGIPEEVRSLSGAPGSWTGTSHPLESATGVLVEPGDAVAMGEAAAALLGDPSTRTALGANAVADATARFDLERQVDATIAWYREVIADWRQHRAHG